MTSPAAPNDPTNKQLLSPARARTPLRARARSVSRRLSRPPRLSKRGDG